MNYTVNIPYKPSDDELADRYCKLYPNTAFRHCSVRRYTLGYWPEISEEQVKKEIMGVLIDAKSTGIRPTNHLLSSVFQLVKINLTVGEEKWDADPNMLVMTNGTLEINSMQLIEHSPSYYITYALPFGFDPSAEAPHWGKLLSRLQEDVIIFLQEFVGLSLTTEMKYEMAIWLVGPKGGGKSTFLAGVETVAGPRCINVNLANIERSRFSLSNIQGKTVGLSAEQPSGYISSSYLLNSIISGERVQIEAKYQNPVDIVPKIKLIWAMNERPRLHSGENGLFRRIKVVDFPALPAQESTTEFKQMIALEGPGILLWALEGLRRLNTRGKFSIPSSVKAATDEFQHSNDVPAIFLEECYLLDTSSQEQASVLYKEYVYWCEDNGHKPISSTALAEHWKRLGLTKRVVNGRKFWVGIRRKSDLSRHLVC